MTLLVNQFKNLFKEDPATQQWPVHVSQGGKLLTDSQAAAFYTKNAGAIELRRATGNLFLPYAVTSTLTVKKAIEIADQVDDAYVTVGDYRRVLNDANWAKLFQSRTRPVGYIHGTTPQTKDLKTMPCYKCGVVLPRTHMTVDHVKPQTGGEDQAVLKVLRNLDLGLTLAQGKGGVAKAYMTGKFRALPTKSGDSGMIDEEDEDTGKLDRYTLSPLGSLFLSICVAASKKKDLQRIQDMCLNSVYNLKPYCAKCNSKKGNKLNNLSWLDS